jgi:hypothetical protein
MVEVDVEEWAKRVELACGFGGGAGGQGGGRAGRVLW